MLPTLKRREHGQGEESVGNSSTLVPVGAPSVVPSP